MGTMDVPIGGQRAGTPSKAAAKARSGARRGVHLLARAGADDHQLGGQPAGRADDGGLRPRRVFLYLVPAIVFLLPTSLVSAELASGWNGGVYNWVSQGISQADGLPRRLVPVRDDDLLLPEPARLTWRARSRTSSTRASPASGLWTAAVIMVCFWTGVWVSSQGTKSVAGLASGGLIIGTLIPGVAAGHPRRGLPRPGQPVGRADGRRQPAARLGRPGQPGADRQQLPVVLRHGDERGARVLAAQPGQGVPARRCSWPWGWCCSSSSCPRWRSAGWCRPTSSASPPGVMQAFDAVFAKFGIAVADPDPRHHAGRRVAGRHAHLARRAVQGPAADLPAGGLPAAVPAEAQQARRPAEHPGRPGRRHHGHRAGCTRSSRTSPARTGSSR